MPDPIVTLESVEKTYAGADAPVLRGANFVVQPGETIAILGPSGSGKTTLLNLIAGLDRPTAGRVSVGGVPLADLGDDELARMRNRDIGFVFQSHNLLPQCTAIENVVIPAMVHPQGRDAAKRGVELLKRVGLADRIDHRPGALSLGQCQRVAVARALINKPRLILADEPTGSLDHANATAVVDQLLALSRGENVAVVFVTHSRELAARMSRTLMLRDGTLT